MWRKNERNPLRWKRENLEFMAQNVPFYTKKNFAFLTIGNFIPKWIVPSLWLKIISFFAIFLTLNKNSERWLSLSQFLWEVTNGSL